MVIATSYAGNYLDWYGDRECYEFIFDSISNASTQGWGETPDTVLLARFPSDPMKYPLFDTMTDELAGVTGAIITGLVMRIILEAKERKI